MMRIISNRRRRALLLLQIAEECPQFKEQAAALAYEWFINASIEYQLKAPGRKRNSDKFKEDWSIVIKRIALAML
jgi:hypothetical protein